MVVAPFETNERHARWSDEYWLRHCEGFRVDCPDRHVGYVEEVRLSLDDGDPEELVVRVGFEGPGMVVVPVAQVALVSPEVERVLIRDKFLL